MTESAFELQNDRLAVEEGPRVRSAELPPWPFYEEDEISAAQAVLRSGRVNYWTGEECRAFEREFAERAGCRFGIALANGTVALELALHVLDIRPGDEVIVPCRTFIASASCAKVRGAIPVMADVDPNSQNITADTIRPLITKATRAIVAVHLAGWPCDMDPILDLAARHGIKVIEDCAQAHGAEYRGRPVGSLGHAGAFSFCQDKIITTGGEGGMLTLNDQTAFESGWAYKDHGKSFDAVYRRHHEPGFRWLHESFGTNWRMTEFQAAIGRRQLAKLDRWVERRRQNALILQHELEKVPGLRLTEPDSNVKHAYYRYYVFLRTEQLHAGWNKQRILDAISAEGIPCYSGSCGEIYREKAFTGLFPPAKRLAVARALEESGLCFRVDPTFGTSEMLDTARAIKKVMKHAAKV
jgi:dTDP-4-amino-4,6-dideoxygalactose transaminase